MHTHACQRGRILETLGRKAFVHLAPSPPLERRPGDKGNGEGEFKAIQRMRVKTTSPTLHVIAPEFASPVSNVRVFIELSTEVCALFSREQQPSTWD
jgi:hypothetical protein